jgi:hypothetical protein
VEAINKLQLLLTVLFPFANRWSLRPAQAAKEEEIHAFAGATDDCTFSTSAHGHGRRASFNLPLVSKWTAVPTSHCHSAALLLSQGRPRLQQPKRWGALDHGEWRCFASHVFSPNRSPPPPSLFSMVLMERKISTIDCFMSTFQPNAPLTRITGRPCLQNAVLPRRPLFAKPSMFELLVGARAS